MTDSLADQIRAQAAISARPGQLGALEAIADQVAKLEEAQRPLLGRAAPGMRDIADTAAFLAIKTLADGGYDLGPDRKDMRRSLADVIEDLLNRLPEHTLAEVREAQS